jgi:hypothetical protein
MRVLFIGNSFTRYWGGQALIGIQLGSSAADARFRPPVYEQSTADGWDLEQHWTAGLALARIREGNWDYVVLQDHSEGPLIRHDAFVRYAKRFDAEIRKVGAKTVLFMTWAKMHEMNLRQPEIAAAYEALGRELGAPVVPVGLAFEQSLAARPDLRLHDADGKHPTEAGSYLTACCFYRFLYGRSPVGLVRAVDDERGRRWLSVDEPTARFLQDVASRAVSVVEPQ